MGFIDTHCHIFLEEFDADRGNVVERALLNNISTLIMPNVDSKTLGRLNNTYTQFPDICKQLIGLHPTSVHENYHEELFIVENELNTGNYIGIGEIGIDLHWEKKYLPEQIKAFIHQLQLAKKYELPVAIHIRDAFCETLESIQKSNTAGLRGVLHCFSGYIPQAIQAIELGYYIGIGGVVTFKNGGIDKVVAEIPLEKIVLETDSPYLAPTPHRGKRNEPSLLVEIARKIASIKNVSVENVASITSRNARDLFKI